MLSYIIAVFSGLVFGITVAGLIIVKLIRKRINKTTDEILNHQLKGDFSNDIAEYVEECKVATTKNLKKKLKKKNPILIVKLVRKIKEKREQRKLYTEEHIPEDESPEAESPKVEPPIETPVEEQVWYPFYLLLHSIAGLYLGDRPLAFLELNEKDVFGIIKKVSAALSLLFNGIGIERLKRIRATVVLETISIVRTVLEPLNKDGIKTAYKTSLQGFKEFNRIKHTISLNPFYHLRVFVKKKITNELVIEATKCAIDVVAIEIVNIYNEKLS